MNSLTNSLATLTEFDSDYRMQFLKDRGTKITWRRIVFSSLVIIVVKLRDKIREIMLEATSQPLTSA